MKIALVHRDLHSRTRGGICTLYHCLAACLVARGHQVTLITQQTPHPVQLAGVEVITLPRTDDMDAHRASVAAALDRLRPDVVECSTWEAETLTYLNRPRGQRAPVLVRGEFSAATLGATDLAGAERALLHRADRRIAVSAFAAHDLATAYDLTAPPVVYNGVDRTRFTPGTPTLPRSGVRVDLDRAGLPINPTPIPALLAAGQPVPPFTTDTLGRARLVWIGKVTAMKGWDLLEDIAVRLADIATITVVLGHSAAYCPVTEVADHVTILHDLDDADLPSLYRSADWLLCTSRIEGFGLAIAEAIACGTPALLPDTLGTAPELLTTAAGYTYRDADELAHILTARPRPAAVLPAQFDWDLNCDNTLHHYTTMIGTSCGSC